MKKETREWAAEGERRGQVADPPETAYPVAADPSRLRFGRLSGHVAARGKSRRERRPPVEQRGTSSPTEYKLKDPHFSVMPFAKGMERKVKWLPTA